MPLWPWGHPSSHAKALAAARVLSLEWECSDHEFSDTHVHTYSGFTANNKINKYTARTYTSLLHHPLINWLVSHCMHELTVATLSQVAFSQANDLLVEAGLWLANYPLAVAHHAVPWSRVTHSPMEQGCPLSLPPKDVCCPHLTYYEKIAWLWGWPCHDDVFCWDGNTILVLDAFCGEGAHTHFWWNNVVRKYICYTNNWLLCDSYPLFAARVPWRLATSIRSVLVPWDPL